MWDVLGSASAVEESVVLATGLANAAYFVRRGAGNAGSRRLAALLLAVLYGGTAVLALALLLGGLEEGAVGVALRAPLTAGNAVTFGLIVIGGRR